MLLLSARVALQIWHFKRIAAWLEIPERSVARNEPDADQAAFAVGRAIAIASRRLPVFSTCFTRALAARSMLRRRGVPAAVSFGLKKGEGGNLLAHAWLTTRGVVLTGGDVAHEYTKVATFPRDAT